MAPFGVRKMYCKQKGMALLICMIFLAVFSALSVSIISSTDGGVQVAENTSKINQALANAESGLEVAKYLISTVPQTYQTSDNTVSQTESNLFWSNYFCSHVTNNAPGGATIVGPRDFTDLAGTGSEIFLSGVNFEGTGNSSTIRFYRYYNDDPCTPEVDYLTIRVQSVGEDNGVNRRISLNTKIQKNADVMKYAVASRGRMWLTGDSTIHGDVFSTWDRPEISPFNTTSETAIMGTVNTVLERSDIEAEGYQMETVDANGLPMDVNGDPLGDNYADRYYSYGDEIQGYHENINYGVPYQDMPGMDISDYDTDDYKYSGGLTTIPSCPWGDRVTEYFPHAASDEGGYSQPRSGSSRQLTRHVYENQTFSDAYLPDNRNALFKNCTFEGVLYIDCYKSTSSYYNNVRFEDCEFNGIIVTDTPNRLKWQYNCLYFTGEATFNNQSDYQEATILAPHFNVNLGNTNPEQNDNNILTGAIVGGIVDVRGNAQIYGTIISMCDTTQWSSGYVTNIGATLNDGGSETVELGDVGVIDITPDEEKMLPSGVTTPIVIKPVFSSYAEG